MNARFLIANHADTAVGSSAPTNVVVVTRDGHRVILRRMRSKTWWGVCGLKNQRDGGYFSKTLVPRIFWLLSVPRKSGTMRSINSK